MKFICGGFCLLTMILGCYEKWSYFFNKSNFNYYFIEHRHIFWVKRENAVPGVFLILLKLYCSIYIIHKFYVFTFYSEFLKFWNSKISQLCMRHHCYNFGRYELLSENYFNGLLVVELQIYREKHLAE